MFAASSDLLSLLEAESFVTNQTWKEAKSNDDSDSSSGFLSSSLKLNRGRGGRK